MIGFFDRFSKLYSCAIFSNILRSVKIHYHGENMLRAIGHRIIVVPIEEKQGLLIVSNAKPQRFEVMAIGEEVKNIMVGDVVYIDKHRLVSLEHEKTTYHVVEDTMIYAVVGTESDCCMSKGPLNTIGGCCAPSYDMRNQT